jgi:hypothetical protein
MGDGEETADPCDDGGDARGSRVRDAWMRLSDNDDGNGISLCSCES